MTRNTSQPSQPDHQPTARERAALQAFSAQAVAPRMKVKGSGAQATVVPDHPDRLIGQLLLMEAIGTTDTDFYQGLVSQIIHAWDRGEQIDEKKLNFILSVVKGVKPKDQTEAMLAAQMAEIHMATMTCARQLRHAETLAQQDSAERALNKLARTFSTQMEALKRYRTGCEQNVRVQHVSVNDGGQAIVGNVTQTSPEAAPKKGGVAPLAIADAGTTPMTIMEPDKERAPRSRRRRYQRND